MTDISRAHGVKVKPLEWKEYPTGTFTGTGAIGKYTITLDSDGSPWLEGRIVRRKFNDVAEGKSHAQADYERRILSALEPTPSEWNAAIEAAEAIEPKLAKSMAHFVRAEEWAAYKKGVTEYLDAIRALKRPEQENT